MGGIVAGLAVLVLQYLYKVFRARSFRQFFGVDGTDDEYNIIYCLFDAPPCPRSDPNCRIIYYKPSLPGNRQTAYPGQNLQQVTSIADFKGVGYLIEAFNRNIKKSPQIVPDTDPSIIDKSDFSFISIGGRTNNKTCNLLDNSSNSFLDFQLPPDGKSIIAKETGTPIAKLANADFGIIVKIHPNNNQERTWICCCGFGVLGTIGASYYLSRKWKQIKKYVGYQCFGLVLRSQDVNEDSYVPMHLIVKKTGRIRDWWRMSKCRKIGIKITLV